MMILQNFSGQQIRKRPEPADGDFLAFEILDAFDLRRHNQAMKQELLRDVDDLSFDVTGNHGVERAGGVGELKGISDETHRAEVAARRKNINVQLFLRKVTVVFGDEQGHRSHGIIGHTDVQFSRLRANDVPRGTNVENKNGEYEIEHASPHTKLLFRDKRPRAR
jgi:hypothetical protein